MNHADRNALPGSEPTDEDLRHDIELTREELGQTAAELAAKADVKRRAIEPVKRNPAPAAAVLLALLALLILLRRLRHRH